MLCMRRQGHVAGTCLGAGIGKGGAPMSKEKGAGKEAKKRAETTAQLGNEIRIVAKRATEKVAGATKKSAAITAQTGNETRERNASS